MDATATPELEQDFSPAREIAARWQKHLESRIKVSPWLSTRASGIGDPCERRIFYRRTNGAAERPYSAELQAIFDLGKHLEIYVVHKLEALGIEVVQRGKDWHDPVLEITGHVDALLSREGWGQDVPTEIKGLNPYTAGTIETIDDIKNHPSAWVRKYYDQLQAYLRFERKALGLFVLLDKSGGGIVPVDCPRDDERIAELEAKARRIRDAVFKEEPPPRTLHVDECERCGFQYLCMPDRIYGDAPVIIENPELEKLLAERAEVEEPGRKFARVDKRIKDMLPDAPLVIVGDFEIAAKQQERAAHTVKATTSWVRKITRLGRGNGGSH